MMALSFAGPSFASDPLRLNESFRLLELTSYMRAVEGGGHVFAVQNTVLLEEGLEGVLVLRSIVHQRWCSTLVSCASHNRLQVVWLLLVFGHELVRRRWRKETMSLPLSLKFLEI